MYFFTDDCSVTGPRIVVQFFHVLNDLCSDRIEVDVTNKSEEIVVFVAKDGFIAILEEMSCAVMASIEVYSVPGEEFFHNCRNALFAAFEQNMDVIVHKDPGIDGTFAIIDCLPEALQETHPVLVVLENYGFVDAPHHDMVQCAGDIETGLTWHDEIL
jgi:hypothetical protein